MSKSSRPVLWGDWRSNPPILPGYQFRYALRASLHDTALRSEKLNEERKKKTSDYCYELFQALVDYSWLRNHLG